MIGFLRNSKVEPGWLAIRFQKSGLELAHVIREGTARPKVLRWEFHELRWEDSDALVRLRKEARLDRYQCTTLLDSNEYQILLVDAPSVPPAELKTAMRWRIKDMIDFHVEDAMVDVVSIPAERGTASRNQSLYVVVARNEAIQKRVALFEAARVPLSVIDIPEMAQRNVAHLVERDGRAVVLLAFDAAGGEFTFTHEGELYLTRRFDLTLGQLEDADQALRRQNFERVALELQRSLDYFDRHFRWITIGSILLPAYGSVRELRTYLGEQTGIPVAPMDLSQVLDLRSVPALVDPERQAGALDVIGAALRLEEKAL